MTTQYDQIQAGWSVHGSDGDKVGEIEEIGQSHLLVTKGLIFPTDLYIPVSAIDNVDAGEGRVYLNVEKSAVEDMGWKEPPTDSDTMAAGAAGSGSLAMNTTSTDYGTEGTTGSAAYVGQSSSSGGTYGSDVDRSTNESTDTLRVPVHEEELRAERTATSAGEVRVDKNVVEEEQTLDVPVTREEVEIRRVSTNRAATTDDAAFNESGSIRVPVTAEEVQVTKEPRVVEEIEISKRPVTETERVRETVRRERVDVDETGDVMVGAGAAMTGTGSELDSGTTGTSSTGYDDELVDRNDDDLTTRR